ncbi:alpha/beta fold hydrolase [Cellulomonas telluris]|uniref:alpha/beta fold hydrolase n=1 Tax=Cellulomonas telluris TaxID=2306636 RepID=UPI0010A8BAE7|nr:alpha/beta fold hydrolase [Cellulomonas telluris]
MSAPDPVASLDRLAAPGGRVGPLWVVARGRGRPLVLLHGNGEDHHVFDRLVPLLGEGRTLVGVDSRGHGRSPRGDGPLTIASMADDVAAVLDLLGLRGVDVLGFSDGGNVALELVLRRPDLVGRLVVVGANLFPEGMTSGFLRTARSVHRLQRALAGRVPALAAAAERTALMTEHPRIDPRDLARVDVPVLVVVGERDLVRPEHTALLAGSLPGARTAVVPRAGHLLPTRHPHELAALVQAFLT